jgi:hypothetical protein
MPLPKAPRMRRRTWPRQPKALSSLRGSLPPLLLLRQPLHLCSSNLTTLLPPALLTLLLELRPPLLVPDQTTLLLTSRGLLHHHPALSEQVCSLSPLLLSPCKHQPTTKNDQTLRSQAEAHWTINTTNLRSSGSWKRGVGCVLLDLFCIQNFLCIIDYAMY